MSDLDLPVVDLSHLHGTEAQRARFIQELGAALQAWGFVAVTGHGIALPLLERAYTLAAAFFALPDAAKRAYERPEIGRQRGYTGFGVEHAKDSDVSDLKEFWQRGRDLPADHPLLASGLMPANLTPTSPEGFDETLGALFRAMDTFANDLLGAICAHVGLDADHLVGAVREGNSVMRVIHYPPVGPDSPPGAVRSAAHEDINLLTVLPASTQPGLELLDRQTGGWRALVTPPDVMICDTGDIMQRLTSGRYPATTHRVVNPPASGNRSRYSMPFFCHPRPDFPLVAMDGDHPPVTAGAFLRERLIANGVLR